jgi:hypothetical protein
VIQGIHDILATSTVAGAVSWKPFLTPMPVWDYWFWLLVPLALGVALAYKCTKCHLASEVPKEAVVLTLWILGGLIAAALGLAVVVHYA